MRPMPIQRLRGEREVTVNKAMDAAMLGIEAEAQHGRLVHILFENGKPCNKWVEVDFNSRSGFSKKQLPKGQMEPLNL